MFLIYLLGCYWARGRGEEKREAVNRKRVSYAVKMYRNVFARRKQGNKGIRLIIQKGLVAQRDK